MQAIKNPAEPYRHRVTTLAEVVRERKPKLEFATRPALLPRTEGK